MGICYGFEVCSEFGTLEVMIFMYRLVAIMRLSDSLLSFQTFQRKFLKVPGVISFLSSCSIFPGGVLSPSAIARL